MYFVTVSRQGLGRETEGREGVLTDGRADRGEDGQTEERSIGRHGMPEPVASSCSKICRKFTKFLD